MWSIYAAERQDALYQAKKTKKRLNKDGSVSLKPNIVYICSDCQGEFKTTEVQVDHIEPIGSTPDFPPNPDTSLLSWDVWLNRVFCEVENLQILCKPCHKTKTARERKNGN